jgi:Immunoglobulin I-set domain
LFWTINVTSPLEHYGNYTCVGKNEKGEERKEVLVKIPPELTMKPRKLDLIEGDATSVECKVLDFDESFSLTWSVDSSPVKVFDREQFKFNASRAYDGKKISCEMRIGNFKSTMSCPVSVKYPPTFINGSHGESFNWIVAHKTALKLDCRTDGKPTGSVRWYFGKDQTNMRPINDTSEALSRDQMTSENEGFYKCMVENTVGWAVKYFNVTEKIDSLSTKEEALFFTGASIALTSAIIIVLLSYLVHKFLRGRTPVFVAEN